jgi:molecular chaperone DnaK (HSP70)
MNPKHLCTVVLAALVGCTSPAEIRIAAKYGGGSILKEDIGIETLGGVFTPLLKAGCKLPCEITQVFSTADDNQDQITIFLFQGTSAMVSGAKKLGVVRVSGIYPAPRGMPQIAVSFIADAEQVVLRAVDKQNKSRLKWTSIDQ